MVGLDLPEDSTMQTGFMDEPLCWRPAQCAVSESVFTASKLSGLEILGS